MPRPDVTIMAMATTTAVFNTKIVDQDATYAYDVRIGTDPQPYAARALAKAQRWLRTVTNTELRAWRPDRFPECMIEEKPKEVGSGRRSTPWTLEEEPATQQSAGGARLITVPGAGDCVAVDTEDIDNLHGNSPEYARPR